jgi:prepilin-type N-terminal cleavage/methylation domain-containing protein
MIRCRRSNGFTLVEMLVALAIFGTVMAGISVVFISSMRAWETARANQSVFEMGRAALQVMERDIAAAFGSVDRNEMQTLVGTSQWLTFVGIMENPKTLYWTGPGPTDGTRMAYSDTSRITYARWPERNLLLRLVEPEVDELGIAAVNPVEAGQEALDAWEAITAVAGPPGSSEVQLEDFELASNILEVQFLYGVSFGDAGVGLPGAPNVIGWNDFEATVAWTDWWDSRTRSDHKLPDVIQVALVVRAESRMPTEETKRRVFRAMIHLPLGHRRPLPQVLQ